MCYQFVFFRIPHLESEKFIFNIKHFIRNLAKEKKPVQIRKF